MPTDRTILATDYQSAPYWWRAAPRPRVVEREPPRKIDVAIVGAGITGLNAAIELARAGRSVAVLDAGDFGAGASSRNAGYVGRTLKHSFLELQARRGLDFAMRVYGELQKAYDSVFERVAGEHIDCHLTRCGRLVVVHSPSQLRALEAEWKARERHLGKPFSMLARGDLPGEIASPLYCGAALIPDLASIHPGLYHLGLLRVAAAAGVAMLPMTAMTALRSTASGTEVATSRGPIAARNVLVATNGYTGRDWGYLARRIVPFDAYMIATERLDPALLDRLLPNSRTYIDDNLNVTFIRRAPGEPRILFGGRTGSQFPNLEAMAKVQRDDLVRVLPDLAGVKVSNAWTGRCSGTRDLYPHIGVRDGIHFAGGYCFAGVPMGTYFGRKAAAMVLGQRDAGSVFAELPFGSLPFVAQSRWLVPLMMSRFDAKDRAAMRAA